MKVEAIKTKDGLLLPMLEELKAIKGDKVIVDIEIVEQPILNDYSALDQLIGICKTNRTDASINHDSIIYNLKNNNDIR